MANTPPLDPVDKFVSDTLACRHHDASSLRETTRKLWLTLSTKERNIFIALASSQDPNPIYNFVMDLIGQSNDQVSLRDVAHRCWETLPIPVKTLFNKLALGENYHQMEKFFGTKPTKAPVKCIVMSTNVFVHVQDVVYCPAEIGIVRFSFVDPDEILSYRTLFDQRDTYVQLKHYHQIQHQHQLRLDNYNYPDLAVTLTDIYNLIHDSTGQGLRYVFVKDSEIYQSIAFFQWCTIATTELTLALNWHIICVPLSLMALYLKVLFKDPSIECDNAHFESETFAVLMDCPAHPDNENPQLCAMSKAYFLVQVLKEKFSAKFLAVQGQVDVESTDDSTDEEVQQIEQDK